MVVVAPKILWMLLMMTTMMIRILMIRIMFTDDNDDDDADWIRMTITDGNHRIKGIFRCSVKCMTNTIWAQKQNSWEHSSSLPASQNNLFSLLSSLPTSLSLSLSFSLCRTLSLYFSHYAVYLYVCLALWVPPSIYFLSNHPIYIGLSLSVCVCICICVRVGKNHDFV